MKAALVGLVSIFVPACGSGEISTPSDSLLPRGRGTANAGEGTDPNPDPLDSTALPQDRMRSLSLDQNPEFNGPVSLAAFTETLYPILRAQCAHCHSSDSGGRLPLHADADAMRAHQNVLGYVNLRQVDASRLISRLSIENHNCWSDCRADGLTIEAAIQAWSVRVGPENLPAFALPLHQGAVSEAQVLGWIGDDKATLAAEDVPYVRYASLHALLNRGATVDEMNTARAGLSKILNSTARYAPEIVNPVAIDDYGLVYRFDVRDYWGYLRSGEFGQSCLSGTSNTALSRLGPVAKAPECGQEIWERITRGNDSVSADDTEWLALGSPLNNSGFHAEYVEAAQLAYTLSRPSVYNEVMQIPFLASALEREVGVDNTLTYQFMTVNDAITIGERLLWRAESTDGYYWKSVDQFSMVDFVFYDRPAPVFTNDRDKSQIITTPVASNDDGSVSTPNRYTGDSGSQAQASEAIFSLPNGLQGYAIFGAGNQRRDDAFTFIVFDPRRRGDLPGDPGTLGFYDFSGKRLLNGASCMGCHASGMNRAPDDMLPYIGKYPRAGWNKTTNLAAVAELYPGDAVMGGIIENDREFFLHAQQQIAGPMLLGTTDKSLQYEPILYLFEIAQLMYGYENTISN